MSHSVTLYYFTFVNVNSTNSTVLYVVVQSFSPSMTWKKWPVEAGQIALEVKRLVVEK
jgi:hypothetical protein